MSATNSSQPQLNRSETDDDRGRSRPRRVLNARSIIGAGLLLSIIAVDPVLAQTSGEAFCETDMALTIKNVFSIIQFGGPLIGGVVALGTTVAMTTVRRADLKKEMKEARNQAVIWGIIVAPLGTAIVQFMLNNVVVGATSCGF